MQILIQVVWGGAETAFITSSQVMLTQLVRGPHLKKQGGNTTCGSGNSSHRCHLAERGGG